jgi:hypothetical protein
MTNTETGLVSQAVAAKLKANLDWLTDPGITPSAPMFELLNQIGVRVLDNAPLKDRIARTVQSHETGYSAHLEPVAVEPEKRLIAGFDFDQNVNIYHPETADFYEQRAHVISLSLDSSSGKRGIACCVDPDTGALLQVVATKGPEEGHETFYIVTPSGEFCIPEGDNSWNIAPVASADQNTIFAWPNEMQQEVTIG